jgi:hypothetical protein
MEEVAKIIGRFERQLKPDAAKFSMHYHGNGESWMNNLIIALDLETDSEAQKFRATAYEWK